MPQPSLLGKKYPTPISTSIHVQGVERARHLERKAKACAATVRYVQIVAEDKGSLAPETFR